MQDAKILLIPHKYFDVPTYAPLSPPLTQYDYEALYYDPSQYCLYKSDIMTEAELPSIIYDWPKRKQPNRLGIINVDTTQANNLENYLHTNGRYSASASAVISMESSPKDSIDTAAPSPIPLDNEDKSKRTIIGGELYNCPRPPPICCDPKMFGEIKIPMDFNIFNRPWIIFQERGFPYNNRPDYEQYDWNVVEEYFLFRAVAIDQNIRCLDFYKERNREIPNWLYVEHIVNKYSRMYRPAKQCQLRYIHSVMPREEGKDQVYDIIGRKTRRVKVSAAEHLFRKRHGKKRLEEFYINDAKKILKASIAAEAKAIVSQPLKKLDFSLVPEQGVNYDKFSETMKERMMERLNPNVGNKFTIKSLIDPDYKLKNWVRSNERKIIKSAYMDPSTSGMNNRPKSHIEHPAPFKKTPLCIGPNGNNVMNYCDGTMIDRIDFSGNNAIRQLPPPPAPTPIVRSEFANISTGPRTFRLAKRPVVGGNIGGGTMNNNNTGGNGPQLMPIMHRNPTLTVSGQSGNRFVQGDLTHQRRISGHSRTGTLSQSSSTGSSTATIQHSTSSSMSGHHGSQQNSNNTTTSTGLTNRAITGSLQKPPQQGNPQQYHSPVVVNFGDRGMSRINYHYQGQLQSHPSTSQSVGRPPVRTMYSAAGGRNVPHIAGNRLQNTSNVVYSNNVTKQHVIIKTVPAGPRPDPSKAKSNN
uniref:SANT domain-containing protein n=1 Tax=Parastrongyloides trichosuri TaxID=131310 RepID=A0A0N4Z1Y9_PARTI